jgi:hypothetical protein
VCQLPLPRLEDKLCSNLSYTRVSRTEYSTERRVPDISIDGSVRIKLRVIEDVEHLQAKLHRTSLCEGSNFMHCHVIVVDTRTVKHTPLGVALRPECIRREASGVEICLPVARVAVEFVSGAVVVWHVDTGGVDSIVLQLH